MVANHLYRFVNPKITEQEREFLEDFPDEKLLMIQERPWFADLENYKTTGLIPKDLSWQHKKKFLCDVNQYVRDDPYLFKLREDNLLRRCVTKEDASSIVLHCHNSPYGGH